MPGSLHVKQFQNERGCIFQVILCIIFYSLAISGIHCHTLSLWCLKFHTWEFHNYVSCTCENVAHAAWVLNKWIISHISQHVSEACMCVLLMKWQYKLIAM